jgi:glutamate dehydrogenase
MTHPPESPETLSKGAYIIQKAQSVKLNPSTLYEAVIDISAEGLLTAKCINMAAGILLEDLGLPTYFFENIRKESLKQILASIANNLTVGEDGKVTLVSRVAHIDFSLEHGSNIQRVRIATEETRDSMETVLENLLPGHRREYYYSSRNHYYTYIIRPETVNDFPADAFENSRFLFTLAGDYTITPEPTRRRYENFLKSFDRGFQPAGNRGNPAHVQQRLRFPPIACSAKADIGS